MERDYYGALEEAITEGGRVVLRTEFSLYFVDCLDILRFLLKKHHVVLLTFDTRTRDLIDGAEEFGADISKLRVVDCVAIAKGSDIAPIRHIEAIYRPDNFNDIQVYTGLFLKELNYTDVVLLYISLDKLEDYENPDEIGVFLHVFKSQMAAHNVPEVIATHTMIDFVIAQIVSNEADAIIPVRKEKIIREE